MMDYYSQFEGPTREDAIEIMKHKFNHVRHISSYATLFVDDEIDKYGGLGSYTGWYVTTKNSIENKILGVYESQLRKDKAKNKFKIFALFIGMMNCKRFNPLKRKYDCVY